jgi:hypothetical protein
MRFNQVCQPVRCEILDFGCMAIKFRGDGNSGKAGGLLHSAGGTLSASLSSDSYRNLATGKGGVAQLIQPRAFTNQFRHLESPTPSLVPQPCPNIFRVPTTFIFEFSSMVFTLFF